MTMINERKEALEALLGVDQPVERLKVVLADFPWDADTELVFLSISHVVNVLNRFVAERMTATDVENWANVIESREDIGFDSSHEQLLRELIHELANPLLTQPLTRERAVKRIKQI